MTRTQKYNFKVSTDQFHNKVDEHYEDAVEVTLIDIFEDLVLDLKQLDKKKYTMVELGSNQSYYSLLFKHILGKNKTTNIMVEPLLENFNLGISQFVLNDCEGFFYNRSIGNHLYGANETLVKTFETPPITLKEILKRHNIDNLDVLQCDIDHSEMNLFNGDSEVFLEKRVSNIFLGTHGMISHNFCKKFLLDCGYKILLEVTDQSVGWDNLIVCVS